LPPTTTTEALSVPAPPPDPHAPEPIVDVGSIEIPKIDVSKRMFEGVSLTVLDHGPGHWPGTAMPGHRGNVVIAGHRTSHDRPFRNIDQLVAGDQVVLTTLEGRFVYEVVNTEVVGPDAIHIIDQADGYTATMFACHPPGSTRQRIVVHLRLSGT
jgi:sortase A